ncbi:MAG: CSLREA domain-containing protein [Caldilinea sp. CFX5]|nr:CSLREA domain-containing protein [Caldilinea sp. CFX5]
MYPNQSSSMFKRYGRRIGVLLLVALLPLLAQHPVRAQSNTFFVNSTADAPDSNLGDGVCAAQVNGLSQCTLRAAIMQANALSGKQVIILEPRIYGLTRSRISEDSQATGDLDITDDLEIRLPPGGRGRAVVNAAALNDRVFEIGPNATVIFANFTVSQGNAGSNFGGGILTTARSLQLSGVIVANNRAANGGGIASTSPSGRLILIDSTVINNQATEARPTLGIGGGGGIFSQSNTSLTRVNITHNRSAFEGGGVHLFVNSTARPLALIRESTFVDNQALNGGGLRIEGMRTSLNNSTISRNLATSRGGGVFTIGTPDIRFLHVTIAGNSALGDGGGVVNDDFLTFIDNSIVANNLVGGDCDGRFATGNNNLLGGCRLETPGLNNRFDLNPLLEVLRLNGGRTLSHQPVAGSPAIEAIPNCGVSTDQRGIRRPQGNGCDIGAIEVAVGANVGVSALVPAQVSASSEQTLTLTFTWTHPVRWRDLATVDLQLTAPDAEGETRQPLWLRFTEGVTTSAGLTLTNGLMLFDSDGNLAGLGEPGSNGVIESDLALVDLAQSRVAGSGEAGQSVALTVAVRFKAAAAGQVYTAALLAVDDAGVAQGPDAVGTVAVGPFSLFLPLVEQ